MNSKKGRAKAEKQAKQRAAERAATGRLMDRAPITPGYISRGNSPFLKKLPREIRDRIYEELLVIRRDQKDQDEHDYLQKCLKEGAPEWQVQLGFDRMDEDYSLCLDYNPSKGAKSIAPNLGILLTCKQVWEEATDILFGKNLFGVIPQHERVAAFWRCGILCQDIPKQRPCQVRPETAIKIRHLFVVVRLLQETPASVSNVKANLSTMADTFQECGTHFLTLKIRYWGQFGGEVEAVRDELEGALPRFVTERPSVMIRHCTTGKFHSIKEKDFDTKLYKNIKILDALKKLKAITDQVDIRGDLPKTYIDELIKTLVVADPKPAAIRTQRTKAALASKQPAPTGGLHGFAAEMLAKDPKMSPGSRKILEDCMKTSRKSPAVMQKIFPELFDSSMHHQRFPPPGSTTPIATSQTATASAAAPGNAAIQGGIGLLNGKPIFGPPRPRPSD